MKAIKNRRNRYAALSVVAILLTVLFIVTQKPEAAIACGGLTAVALILLYRQSRFFYVASVIVDSRILAVPSSVITIKKGINETAQEEAIVSTFGLLLGDKVYKWGWDGVYGTRLREVRIDKEHICLSFGDDGKMLRVELLHGLTDKQSVLEFTRKLWHETGVQPEISDW